MIHSIRKPSKYRTLGALSLLLTLSCANDTEFSASSSARKKDPNMIQETFTQRGPQRAQQQISLYQSEMLTLKNPSGLLSERHDLSVPAPAEARFDLSVEDFVQNFRQNDLNKTLDIVVVVDNSSSMKDEQEKLSEKLTKLISYVEDADWKVAVMTTDPDDSCRGIVTKEEFDLNPEEVRDQFKRAVKPGIDGSHIERGILQAVNGLKSCQDTQWVRPDSTVAVLIVSDEDNCTHEELADEQCRDEGYKNHTYLTDYLAQDLGRTLGESARVYGIIWSPWEEQNTALNQGKTYLKAIEATRIDRTPEAIKATTGTIWADDYSNVLERISKDINQNLKYTYTLEHTPIDGNITIYENETKMEPSQYTVQGQTIQFSKAPIFSADIRVEYQFNSQDNIEFNLEGFSEFQTLKVSLDGNPIPADDFSYDQENQKIAFRSNMRGRTLNVTAVSNEVVKSEFTLNQIPEEGSLQVILNDTALSTDQFSFSESDLTVRLNETPPNPAIFEVRYNPVPTPQLNYDVSIEEEAIPSLRAFDVETNETIPHSIDGKQVIFQKDDVIHERKVLLRWENHHLDHANIKLDHKPISKDDLKVWVDETTQCDSDLLQLNEDGTLNLEACGFDTDREIKIDYNYQGLGQEFVIDDDRLASHPDAKWTVKVDDQEVTDYVVERINNKAMIKFKSLDDTAKKVYVQVNLNP